MKRSRFTETQIPAILAEAGAWMAVQRFVAGTGSVEYILQLDEIERNEEILNLMVAPARLSTISRIHQ